MQIMNEFIHNSYGVIVASMVTVLVASFPVVS